MLRYRFPVPFVARWLLSALLRRRRDLAADGRVLFTALGARLRVEGAEHVPADGVFVVVMNHYERDGLRVWWPATAVTMAVAERRGERPAVRWLITDRFYRFRLPPGIPVPQALVSWGLGLVAYAYDLLLVPRDGGHAWGRAISVHRTARALRSPEAPRPVGVTPEGERANGPDLVHALPNSGPAIAWATRGEMPVVPAAVHEDAEGSLVVRFGPPFTVAWPGLREAKARREAMTAEVMRRIAVLLPAEIRGDYAGETAKAP